MKTVLLIIAMSQFLSTSCDAADLSTINNLPAANLLNLPYGPDSKQVLDIHLPAHRSREATKVMFLVHGGGWSGGDKRDFKVYIDSLQNYLPGYCFVNVNYRLADYTRNKFPTQENDIKAAVSYVMERADEYGISKDIVLLGTSAGAHLSLLQAYKHREPVRAKAVISFFGPSDIAYIYNNPPNPQAPMLLKILMGGTPAENPAIYKSSSPINYIDATSCPTLMFQGGKDQLVDMKQAKLLQERLEKAGVINEFVLYPNEGHGWWGLPLGDSFARIGNFLQQHVK